jgi:hypothetical protein
MRVCLCEPTLVQDYTNANDLLCEATIVLPAGRGELHHTFETVMEGEVGSEMPSVRTRGSKTRNASRHRMAAACDCCCCYQVGRVATRACSD